MNKPPKAPTQIHIYDLTRVALTPGGNVLLDC